MSEEWCAREGSIVNYGDNDSATKEDGANDCTSHKAGEQKQETEEAERRQK